ncbi:multiple epidermal growth factor-like domains protein 10 [Dreissena polymorpha]|uniref:multiple epidermal growth factor-like domains protein 10 n=1 Tax=Dreissena polymorpha TaxID=45954 RepID=UPI002265517D|nr:multiple epidermal growth factor-like domains protein 10 [Dreissena polymorpha]
MYIGNDVSQMVERKFSEVNKTVRTCVLSPPQAMQAIIVIGQRGGVYMTICEIEVYRQQDCVNGTYGPDCNKTCHCVDGPCDAITGACGTGCKRGWRGSACNETCADGSYGTNCSLTCSAFCRNNRPCHHINGTCIEGCADGYDFSTDKTCNTPCGHRRYGRDCSSICSEYCHNKQTCHHINGTCPNGCGDGYDFNLDKTCNTTCKNRTFGKNCSMDCNCDKCHHINGSCAIFEQLCDTGFKIDKDICQRMLY